MAIANIISSVYNRIANTLNCSVGAVQEVNEIPLKHLIVIGIHKNQFPHAGSTLNCDSALLSRLVPMAKVRVV